MFPHNRTISKADILKYTPRYVWHSIYTKTLYDDKEFVILYINALFLCLGRSPDVDTASYSCDELCGCFTMAWKYRKSDLVFLYATTCYHYTFMGQVTFEHRMYMYMITLKKEAVVALVLGVIVLTFYFFLKETQISQYIHTNKNPKFIYHQNSFAYA